jgi:hypothetical protein
MNHSDSTNFARRPQAAGFYICGTPAPLGASHAPYRNAESPNGLDGENIAVRGDNF